MASRGICPSQLKDNSLWWNGPSWLLEPSTEWPTFYQHEENRSSVVAVVHSNTVNKSEQFLKVIEKFSSFDMLT